MICMWELRNRCLNQKVTGHVGLRDPEYNIVIYTLYVGIQGYMFNQKVTGHVEQVVS